MRRKPVAGKPSASSYSSIGDVVQPKVRRAASRDRTAHRDRCGRTTGTRDALVRDRVHVRPAPDERSRAASRAVAAADGAPRRGRRDAAAAAARRSRRSVVLGAEVGVARRRVGQRVPAATADASHLHPVRSARPHVLVRAARRSRRRSGRGSRSRTATARRDLPSPKYRSTPASYERERSGSQRGVAENTGSTARPRKGRGTRCPPIRGASAPARARATKRRRRGLTALPKSLVPVGAESERRERAGADRGRRPAGQRPRSRSGRRRGTRPRTIRRGDTRPRAPRKRTRSRRCRADASSDPSRAPAAIRASVSRGRKSGSSGFRYVGVERTCAEEERRLVAPGRPERDGNATLAPRGSSRARAGTRHPPVRARLPRRRGSTPSIADANVAPTAEPRVGSSRSVCRQSEFARSPSVLAPR